jgi:DNA polymerase III subunit delta'
MSMAAERQRADTYASEPDRLEGFSSPREVDHLFGHEAAVAEFEDARGSGRLHHAWLLVGPEGIGKATLAYRLARTLLAEGDADVANDPSRPLFRKVASLAHPNVLLLRRSFNEKTKRYGQWIGVDEVRRLRSFLGHSAGEGGWRVVVVDRADEMNQNAANALLKALEEPPPRTLFLLVASAEGRLPVTIRSRTRTLRVSGLNEEELAAAVRAALVRYDHEVDDEVLATALALSDGSVRRALELATGDGIALYREIVATLGALPEFAAPRLHALADRLAGSSQTDQLALYVSLLLGLIERLIRFAATGEGATEEERPIARKLVGYANLGAWAEAWEAIAAAKDEAFALNLDRTLLLLDIWFRLSALVRKRPV